MERWGFLNAFYFCPYVYLITVVIFLMTNKYLPWCCCVGVSNGNPLCMENIYSLSHLFWARTWTHRRHMVLAPASSQSIGFLLKSVGRRSEVGEYGDVFLRNGCSSGNLMEIRSQIAVTGKGVRQSKLCMKTWGLWIERKMHAVGLWRVNRRVGWRGKRGLFWVQLPKLPSGLWICPIVIKARKWHDSICVLDTSGCRAANALEEMG